MKLDSETLCILPADFLKRSRALPSAQRRCCKRGSVPIHVSQSRRSHV
jgi:hypothetical protein